MRPATILCTLNGAAMTDSELIAILSNHRREQRDDMKDAVDRVENGLRRDMGKVEDNLKEDNDQLKAELKADINGVKLELTKKDGVLDRLTSLEENSREQTPVSIVHTRAKKTTKEKVTDHAATAGIVAIIVPLVEIIKTYLTSK